MTTPSITTAPQPRSATARSAAVTTPRPATDPSTLLRRAFQVNAASSAMSGVAFLVGGAALARALGAPTSLAPVGISLLLFAAFVGWLSARPAIPLRAAWVVVALDALWVAASVVEIALGVYTTVGNWVFGGMALFVAVLADVQALGILRIRRARRSQA